MFLRAIASSLCCALVLAPGVASAQFVNTIPWTNLSTKSPVFLTASSTFVNTDGSIRLCVSFRNLSNKTANAVRITLELDDLLGHPLREAIIDRSGSFAPGILIEGKMDALGGNSDSFANCATVASLAMAPRSKKVDVTEVGFTDGTHWKKGDSYVQAFDARGNHVTGGTVSGTSGTSGTSAPEATRVEIGGATAVGGSVGPAGNLFGTIAWVPGSRTVYGVSVDAQTQDEADFAAMTACTQLNHGNPGCKPAVRMTGTDKKCGAVATDGQKTAIAFGPDVSSTIQSVLAVLAKEGGAIESNSIVSSKCNSH